MRRISEKAYKLKEALRGSLKSESELRKALREATNNQESTPDTKILYCISDFSESQDDFQMICQYFERKVQNVKKSNWRRFTKVCLLITNHVGDRFNDISGQKW